MDTVCYYIALLTLGFVSCHSERATRSENLREEKTVETEESEVLTVVDTVKEVEMWLTPNVFKANDMDKTVRCRFQNNTKYRLPLGTQFSIEKWDGNKWVFQPYIKHLVFPDLLLHTLSPKESVDLDHDYRLSKCLPDGAKEKGKYRMVVDIDVWMDYKLEKQFKTFAEFTVE